MAEITRRQALGALAGLTLIGGCASQGVVLPSAELAKRSSVIGNNRRKAVFYECFYGLRQSWLNPPNEGGPFGGRQYNGDLVGDWSYISSDMTAFNHVRGRWNSSTWYGTADGSGNISVDTSAASLPASYTMHQSYVGGQWIPYERTGQCLFTAALILYRATYSANPPQPYDLPNYWPTYSATGESAANAIPGDVVYYKTGLHSGHIGICVAKNSQGIDVVDANYVGYGSSSPCRVVSSQPHSEMLARHFLHWSTISSGNWIRFSGLGKWYGTADL